MDDSEFSERISSLEKLTSNAESSFSNIDKSSKACIPYLPILYFVILSVISLIIYFINPLTLQYTEGEKKSKRDPAKYAKTIGIVGVFLLIGMYLFTYCKGYSTGTFICGK